MCVDPRMVIMLVFESGNIENGIVWVFGKRSRIAVWSACGSENDNSAGSRE